MLRFGRDAPVSAGRLHAVNEKDKRMVGHNQHIDNPPAQAASRPAAREREERGADATGGVDSTPRSGLGNTTKFTDEFPRDSAPKSHKNQRVRETVDPETGEIFSWVYDEKRECWAKQYDEEAFQLERWLLLRSAQRILSRPQFWEDRVKKSRHAYTDLSAKVRFCDLATREEVSMLAHELEQPVTRNKLHDIDGSKSRSPVFRVVGCYRSKVPGRQPELWRSPESGRVAWHNVGVCGSVWTCPCCAPKINLGRRDEISRAYEAVTVSGGCAYMFTFTIKHGIGDDLVDLAAKYKDAMQVLQKSQAFKEATRRKPLKRPRPGSLPWLGYLGRIANLEVTYGEKNGWHPHEHHLWFFDREMTALELRRVRDSLFDAWSDACDSVGLPRPLKTVKIGRTVRYLGLDVRKAMSAAEYLTKYGAFSADGGQRERRWGPEKELASSHVKQARAKGRTPFQLLSDYAEGDKQAGQKFTEFAHAFLGRHQLQFSRSLKAWLKDHQIEIIEGEEGDIAHAAAMEEEAQQLGELTDMQFEKVVNHALHGVVLSICRQHGFDYAVRFIDRLPLRSPVSTTSGVPPHGRPPA
jgi:hypothetical protein